MLKSRPTDGKLFRQTSWPSGLRRCVQVAVLIGAGSNPADVIYFLGPVTCLLAFGARRQVQYHRVYPSGPPWLHSLALDFCPSFVSARFFTSGRRSSSAGSLIASAHFFAPLVRSSGPRLPRTRKLPGEGTSYLHTPRDRSAQGNHRITPCCFSGGFFGLKIIEKSTYHHVDG